MKTKNTIKNNIQCTTIPTTGTKAIMLPTIPNKGINIIGLIAFCLSTIKNNHHYKIEQHTYQ